jgi:hypothetical protein
MADEQPPAEATPARWYRRPRWWLLPAVAAVVVAVIVVIVVRDDGRGRVVTNVTVVPTASTAG